MRQPHSVLPVAIALHIFRPALRSAQRPGCRSGGAPDVRLGDCICLLAVALSSKRSSAIAGSASPTVAEMRPGTRLRLHRVLLARRAAVPYPGVRACMQGLDPKKCPPRATRPATLTGFPFSFCSMWRLGRRLSAPCGSSPSADFIVAGAKFLLHSRRQKRPVEQKTRRENYLP